MTCILDGISLSKSTNLSACWAGVPSPHAAPLRFNVHGCCTTPHLLTRDVLVQEAPQSVIPRLDRRAGRPTSAVSEPLQSEDGDTIRAQNSVKGEADMHNFCEYYHESNVFASHPLIVVVDDSNFTSENFDNFLWVTFTRSNPALDIYGIRSFSMHKHWGCKGSLIIDARGKPHHAPVLEVDKKLAKRVEKMAVLKGVIQ